MSAAELLRDPVPRNGQALCVTGRWRSERLLLVLDPEAAEAPDIDDLPLLNIVNYPGRVENGAPATVCGRLSLDERCFEKASMPGQQPFICTPFSVELDASGKKR